MHSHRVVAVARIDEVEEGRADDLLRRQAEDLLAGLVHVGEGPGGVRSVGGVAEAVEEVAQPAFAVHGRLQPLSPGHAIEVAVEGQPSQLPGELLRRRGARPRRPAPVPAHQQCRLARRIRHPQQRLGRRVEPPDGGLDASVDRSPSVHEEHGATGRCRDDHVGRHD